MTAQILARRNRRCVGYTLLEILYVVVVVAAFLAILVPAYTHSRAKARQTACQNNLRRIGIALLAYAEDFDGRFPPSTVEAPGQTNVYEMSWLSRIEPYTKGRDVFVCPSAPMRPALSPEDLPPSTNVADSGSIRDVARPLGGPVVSYAMTARARFWAGNADSGESVLYTNPYDGRRALYDGIGGYTPIGGLSLCGGPTHAAPSHSVREIVRAAETVLVMESSRYDNGACAGSVSNPRSRHSGEVVESPVAGMGLVGTGVVNTLFSDGHAKTMRASQLFEVVSNPDSAYYRFFSVSR